MPRSPLLFTLLALTVTTTMMLTTGCASSGSKGDAAGAAAASSALPAVPADKSRIVFYRPSSAIGSLDKPNVFADGYVVGKSESGTYSYADIAPGQHAIECKGGGGDTADANRISVQTTAGATTYLETSVKPGINNYKVNVQQKPESEATAKIAKLKFRPPIVPAPTPAAAAPAAAVAPTTKP